MYAQLCKRLSIEAQNFENSDKNKKPDQPSYNSTFLSILLSVCRDKFENRSSDSNALPISDTANSNTSPTQQNGKYLRDDQLDEEERKYIAKQKMLGNVKFIAELFTLEMLDDKILHKCIKELLSTSSQITQKERCENMECLSQIVRTCGKIVDSEKSKTLMDQYFERIDQCSQSAKYPPRIRFMLRDLIELRRNGWVPRKSANTEAPVPMQQLRPDDDTRFTINEHSKRDQRNIDRDSDSWMSKTQFNYQPNSNYNSSLIMNNMNIYNMNQSYNSSPVGGNMGGNGRGNDRNSERNMDRNNDRMGDLMGGGGAPGGYRHNPNRERNNMGNHNHNHNHYNNHNRYNKHNNNSPHPHNNYNNNAVKQLPPRFKQSVISPQTNQQSPDTFDTFRPPINSLLYKATNSNRQTAQLPISQQPRPASASSVETTGSTGTTNYSTNVNSPNSNYQSPSDGVSGVALVPPPQSAHNILNKDQVVIKSASQEKPKQNKKDKGPNKEEILKRVLIFVKEWLAVTSPDNDKNMDDVVAAFFELKIPDKFMRDSMTSILNEIIDKSDIVYDRVIEFLTCLRKEGKLQNNTLLESFKSLINGMNDSPVPRITTLVASLLSRSVIVKLFKLADVANYTENGAHYPLFLLVLQQLYKTLGKQALLDIFNESKVNLMSSLPEADRTKDRMAEILEDRNLSFLYPLLKLQGELQKQIQNDPNPQSLYKWIKDNVESICYNDPGFVTALMNVILKYVTQETTLAEGIDPTVVPEKSLIDKELTLLKKYCPVLNAFLNGNGDLQLVAIFAMQVFCYSYNFPKGMLLRWFSEFYDNNVIEEESYMRWKEDLGDVYPGKGKALFQVNTYLTYLEEAEEEEDDDEDE
ncbi:eukaryotic translation initiation factor 4 gamma 2 [Contarinia nasturtii]|uniref:eukaryotic translation initiation factor 4 gamma 2 n=1 Tax=Contarinia nasturtii TaxID=265458 RepID=UPI0012D424CC|nr:eukaryotic translation initiation factor 4 gamma 2 [Contarinia nasturtii]